MQLSKRVGAQSCAIRRKAVCPAALTARLQSPPALPAPCKRLSVLAHAKRSSKQTGKKADADATGGDEGWDAALANIPTEDDGDAEEADSPSPSSRAPGADEELSTSDPEPSTSSGPGSGSQFEFAPEPAPKAGSGSKPKKPRKPPSTVLTLAEYGMLMAAKEAKEREEAERREREAREAAGGSALVVPEAADLSTNRQGFQAFALEGGDMELLVAETVDGRLALADSYVGAKQPAPGAPAGAAPGANGMYYGRPELAAEVPSEPLLFQVIPWVERGTSDTLKRKPAVNKVKKIYFIGVEPGEGGEPIFDLGRIYLFDGESRALSRSEVRYVGQMPLMEPVLRIRPQGITVEEAYLLPDPIQVSMDSSGELPELTEEELAEKLEELEKAAEELDELDEAPDVPGVDMM